MWGIEGQSYKLENGNKVIIDPGIITDEGSTRVVEHRKKYGVFHNLYCLRSLDDYYYRIYKPETAEYLKYIRDNGYVRGAPIRLKLTGAESEEEKALSVQFKDYFEEMSTRFIFGDADIATEWNTYVAEARKRGGDKLLEIYTKAWNRQK
jgi:putative aldouronate transport system substrate-binding protein